MDAMDVACAANRADVERFLPILQSKLDAYRYRHSLAVADEAKRLALRYGYEKPETAYLAGLLHDITKNQSDAQQLQMCERFGIILTDLERTAPKLWHAITGAACLRAELGVDDPEILRAVRYHTTGRAGMSLLEQILYLADFTSADRTYPDVEEMRRLVDVGIAPALRYALRYTITELVGANRPVHPDTFEAYNEVVAAPPPEEEV